VAFIYLLLGLPFVRLARYSESRLGKAGRSPAPAVQRLVQGNLK
jgi:hypothetical protein